MAELPRLRSAARDLFPRGTRRRDGLDRLRRTARALAGAGADVVHAAGEDLRTAPVPAGDWLASHRRAAESESVAERLARRRPPHDVLHVVVIGGDPRGDAADATRSALDAQRSGEWRLWAVHDLEGAAERCRQLAETAPADPVTVLMAGDRPTPDLVSRVLDLFWERPHARVVHWDEAAAADGRGLRFRPTWSPDLMTSANALGRAFALRARHWVVLQPGLGPDAWWDVLLAADLSRHEVERLALVGMYSADPHPAVGPHAAAVVGEEIARRDWPARPLSVGDAVWLDWDLPAWPSVTVVVPSRHNRPLLERLLPSLCATDYPDLQVVVVDNSGRDDAEQWYARWEDRLDLEVLRWDRAFNYSAVNNAGAAAARGEVLVFCNDDVEAIEEGWLRQMVGWATRAEVGTVGAQLLDPAGLVQHGGVVLGMDGSAGHLFAGGPPRHDSLLGHTDWTRNVLASTAACVAVRREVFADLGGFDERFVLCGSDVTLGLDAHIRGLRNVVTPAARLLHLESATRGRGSGVPEDLWASWWRYQPFVVGGDPFHSPSLSLQRGWPTLRPPGEPSAKDAMLTSLGRPTGVFRQEVLEDRARELALAYPLREHTVEAVREQHAGLTGRHGVRTLNWFLPGFDNPNYGGIATILRIAGHLARAHGVEQRFVVLDWSHGPWYPSAFAAADPLLADCSIVHLDGDGLQNLDRVPPADAAVATMWTSAYAVSAAPAQARRFYLVQDFEPCFYPAGTMYALAEETYRLGLYGICNTEPIHRMYTERYGGRAGWFLPAVDTDVFHPHGRADDDPDRPVRVFVYARPGHWRNCWELAEPALERVKETFGDRVHLVTAGSWASPDDLGGGIQHLGLMDVRSTGELYRRCDVGVALTTSEHPSYLPLELMACGVPVVAFDMPEADWILHHERTGLRSRRTVGDLADQIGRLVSDRDLRRRCSTGAVELIRSDHADWEAALSGVHDMLCDPEAGDR